MDSSKTLLPHSATWSKDVVKDKLLKIQMACVKYNGMRLDDVHTHERVDQVFSKYSRRLGGHSAKTLPKLFRELRHEFTRVCNFEIQDGVIDLKEFLGGALPTTGHVLSIAHAYYFSVRKLEKPVEHAVHAESFMSQWSDTDVHGPEHFLKYMPEGKPSNLPARPIFHSHKDKRGKTFLVSEAEAEKRARNAAELPHNAEAAVGRMIEVMEGLRRLEWNPVTTIGPGKTKDDSIKQLFDAGQGNLPWVPDYSGNPEIPPWLAVDLARIEGRPVPDTSWEVAQTMPWRPMAALPMRTYDRYYIHLGGVASSSFTTNFMGTSVPAVSLLGKTFGGGEKVLEQWEPWNDLLIVMHFQGHERVDGVYMLQDSLDHMRLRLEYIELKTFLTAFQNNDPRKIEAARKMRPVQAYLPKGRKQARELAEMDIDRK
eukprot:jgi/Tetstr1/435928/TSEL_024810.t1